MTHHILETPVTEAEVRALKIGDTVTLEKTLFGVRDANLIAMFDKDRKTIFDMKGHAVVHTAPNVRKVPVTNECPSGYEAMCVGTTTSQRMERFTRPLMEREGVRIIIGKGGMGQGTLDAFRDIGGAYLAVGGGAAALQTTWIESIEEVDMDDLNPESIWRFRIKGFGPLLVTMDSHGSSTYEKIQGDAKSKRDAILASIGASARCMSVDLYLAYVVACFVIPIIPGPTVTLIVANSLTHGPRAGLLNMAGTQLGLALMMLVLVVGLSSIIATMGYWFDWLRFVGAAYLIWIGWKLLRSSGGFAQSGSAPVPRGGFSLQGLLV